METDCLPKYLQCQVQVHLGILPRYGRDPCSGSTRAHHLGNEFGITKPLVRHHRRRRNRVDCKRGGNPTIFRPKHGVLAACEVCAVLRICETFGKYNMTGPGTYGLQLLADWIFSWTGPLIGSFRGLKVFIHRTFRGNFLPFEKCRLAIYN